MRWKIVLFISLRYIFRKTTDQFSRCIYWITSFSIMLGIAILVVVLSVMNGFERDVKKYLLCYVPHIFLTTKQGFTHIHNFPDLFCDRSRNIKYIQPLVMSDVVLQSATKISTGSMLGINPNSFAPLSSYLMNRSINQLVAGQYFIIIGSALAHYLQVNINDQIRLIVPHITQVTPFGNIPSQKLFTISDIYETHGDIDTYQVLIHQLDAVKLMHYPSPYCITGWRLWLYNPLLIDNFCKSSLSNSWIWKDWREYKKSMFQAMQIEKNIMSLLLGLIIIAACFSIMSFLILLITEKRGEVAILQTYGFTRIHVMSMFMVQGVSSGILGIMLGVTLGVLLSQKLNRILSFFHVLPNSLQFPVEIQSFQILIITITTFIIIILITLYPSWYAASISPAKILHYG